MRKSHKSLQVLISTTGDAMQTKSADVADRLISDQLLRAGKSLPNHTLLASQPLELHDSVPIINDVGTVDGSPSTRVRPLTIKSGASYRSLLTKMILPVQVQGLNKRKHTSRLHPVPHPENMGSDDEDPGSCSGDGSVRVEGLLTLGALEG